MDPVNLKMIIIGGGLLLLRLIMSRPIRTIPYRTRLALCEYLDSGLAASVIAFIIASFLIQVSRVEGISMRPNLHTGEYALIEKVSYRFHTPRRGDVIVFRSPVDPGKDYIKRVIGLPGEMVEVRQARVYINGRPLVEKYTEEPPYYLFGPERVPKHSLFVLGDNRNQSLDSHRFHFLDDDAIRGRAVVIVWPFRDMGRIPPRN
jgi:signal peptidase I